MEQIHNPDGRLRVGEDMQVSGMAVPFAAPSVILRDEESGIAIREMLAPDCEIEYPEAGVQVYIEHDRRLLIASTKNSSLELERREDGLYFTASLVDTDEGRRVRTLIREGLLDGVSIGALRLSHRWARTAEGLPLKILTRVRITHISPVAEPAYPQTFIRSAAEEVLRHRIYVEGLRKEYPQSQEIIQQLEQDLREATADEIEHMKKENEEPQDTSPEEISGENQAEEVTDNQSEETKDEEAETSAAEAEPPVNEEEKEDNAEAQVQENIEEKTEKMDSIFEQIRVNIESGNTKFTLPKETFRSVALADGKGLQVAEPVFTTGMRPELFDRLDLLPAGSGDARIMVYPDFVGGFQAEGVDATDLAVGTGILAQPKPLRASAVISEAVYDAEGGAAVLATRIQQKLRESLRKGVEDAIMDAVAGDVNRPGSIFAGAAAVAAAQPTLADLSTLEGEILGKSNNKSAIVFICGASTLAALRAMTIGQTPVIQDGKLFGEYDILLNSKTLAKPHFGFLDCSAVKVQPFGDAKFGVERWSRKAQVACTASMNVDVVYPGAAYAVRKGA